MLYMIVGVARVRVLIRETFPIYTQSDKKFYLDQAKKLKDNFNSKYPYRRSRHGSECKGEREKEEVIVSPRSIALAKITYVEASTNLYTHAHARSSGPGTVAVPSASAHPSSPIKITGTYPGPDLFTRSVGVNLSNARA